jgi:hypothetical protein
MKYSRSSGRDEESNVESWDSSGRGKVTRTLCSLGKLGDEELPDRATLVEVVVIARGLALRFRIWRDPTVGSVLLKIVKDRYSHRRTPTRAFSLGLTWPVSGGSAEVAAVRGSIELSAFCIGQPGRT